MKVMHIYFDVVKKKDFQNFGINHFLLPLPSKKKLPQSKLPDLIFEFKI